MTRRIPAPRALVVVAAGVVAVGISAEVPGQERPAPVQTIERIEVTGSLVSKIAGESPLPVTTITAADIAKTGLTSVTDLIQQLPAMQGFVPSSSSINGGGVGITTAALHSLPSKYTLVLLDGKRVTPFTLGSVQGFGFGVNLESLPIDAIERIEVLTDGASTLYGSDAIAGVVNFVLKKNTTQGSVYLHDDITQHTGGGAWGAGINKGFGDLDANGYNVLLSYSHDGTTKLDAKQRDFSKRGAYFPFGFNGVGYFLNNRTSNTEPANIKVSAYPTGGNPTNVKSYSFNPYYEAHGNCGTPFAGVLLLSIGESCRFNYAATVEDLPRTDRDVGLVKASVKLNENTTAWGELLLSDAHLIARFAPPAQPFGINATNRIPTLFNLYVLPFLASHNLTIDPAHQTATVGYRGVSAGGRTDDFNTQTQHLSVGVDGSALGFEYKANATVSHARLFDRGAGGYFDYNGFSSLIASGVYDPIAGTGGAALQPLILHNDFEVDTSDTDTLHLEAQHDTFTLPGGKSVAAAGFEYIYTRYRKAYDTLLLNGSGFSTSSLACNLGPCDYPVGGFLGRTPFDAFRDNWAVFGEWDFPVIRQLEVDAAVRYDAYSRVTNHYNFSSTKDSNGVFDQIPSGEVGNTFNKVTGKVSFRLTPIERLLVRGAYGTGFRAPAINDIANPAAPVFNSNTAGTYPCPIPNSPNCTPGSAQYDLVLEGNPLSGNFGLKPEKSRQWTIGLRFEPVKEVSLGADLWNLKLTDQILSQGIPEALAFNNYNTYKRLFIDGYADPAGFNTIALIEQPFNGGEAEYRGLDFDFLFRSPTPYGKFLADWSGTWMFRQRYNFGPGLPFNSDLGNFGPDQGVVFRLQFNLTASLETGPFTNTLVAHYKSGYTDEQYKAGNGVFLAVNGAPGPSVDFPGLQVPAFVTFDWQLAYKIKSWELAAGIFNLFDKDPPLSLQTGGGGNEVGYDGRYYDPNLRTFYLRAKYNF